MNKPMQNPIRYTATVCIETTTPLSVGSGFAGLTNDRLIARDANYLPFIPGTGLAGALRHALSKTLDNIDSYFGSSGNDNSEGSRIILSSAHVVMLNGSVADGLTKPDKETEKVYSVLPSRDHVRINEYGVADAKEHGKFEEELLLAGSRFVFSLEMIGNGSAGDNEAWEQLIATLSAPFFRIGGGTRKGFGAFKVEALEEHKYDLSKANSEGFRSAAAYLEQSSRLKLPTENRSRSENNSKRQNGVFTHYSLKLKPCNFFFFGGQELDVDEAMLSGTESPKFLTGVDDNFKTEKVLVWTADGRSHLSEKRALIPATSVKGALSHRLAFHYNKAKLEKQEYKNEQAPNAADALMQKLERLADIPEGTPSDSPLWQERISQIEKLQWPEQEQTAGVSLLVGEENEAVLALFGRAAEVDKKTKKQIGRKGTVLVEDCYIQTFQPKIFDHVKIDRFTGGASDGALFQEKTITTSEEVTLSFWVEEEVLQNEVISAAWEKALHDVANGRLALGGKTTKGHGLFMGEIFKNGQKLPEA